MTNPKLSEFVYVYCYQNGVNSDARVWSITFETASGPRTFIVDGPTRKLLAERDLSRGFALKTKSILCRTFPRCERYE